jgi:hypothetical protein
MGRDGFAKKAVENSRPVRRRVERRDARADATKERAMEFMLIMITDRDAPDDPSIYPEMGKFAGELAGQGKIRGGSPLHPETEGARVRVRKDRPLVTDGPLTETKEVIGGYFLIECESAKEALEIARRCPHARVGTVELEKGRAGDG